jgi:hypothetical protein
MLTRQLIRPFMSTFRVVGNSETGFQIALAVGRLPLWVSTHDRSSRPSPNS